MIHIGQYRMDLYRLLFRHPICRYPFRRAEGEEAEHNVLILGSGYVGDAALRACLWAGLYPQRKLNITLASHDADTYRDRLTEILPGLSDLPAGDRIGLRFRQVNDLNDEDDLFSLDFESGQYRYVIVALGDPSVNYLAADMVKELITLSAADEAPAFIIHVFDENAPLPDGGAEDANIRYFGHDTRDESDMTLARYAKNIHYAYASKYQERVSKEETDLEFDTLYTAEFERTDHEDPLMAFIGGKYNADSSLAGAVCIPTKAAYCTDLYGSDIKPADALSRAVFEKSRAYDELIRWEHRRWVAYMTTRGYRMPRTSELGYIYRDGHSHQTKGERAVGEYLHICMCDCGAGGLYLRDHPQLWDLSVPKLPANLSPLDRASLICHRIACDLSENVAAIIRAPAFYRVLETPHQHEFLLLRKAVDKLLRDDENAAVLYDRARLASLAVATPEQAALIDRIDELLGIVKIRNRRTDFFEYDAQLVDLLPFCVRHGVEYKTVITVTDGNLAQDVILPTLLTASEAVFIGTEMYNKQTQAILHDYFARRGHNTKPIFRNIPAMTVEAVSRVVDALLSASDPHACILCCTSTRPEALLALGRYLGRVTILHYDRNAGIIDYEGAAFRYAGLDNKSFSVDEYIHLCGGKIIRDPTGNPLSPDDMDNLADAFKDGMMPRTYLVTKEVEGVPLGSRQEYTLWLHSMDFFRKNTVAEKIIFAPEKQFREPISFHGRFLNDVYTRCRLQYFLSALKEYRMIGDLCIETAEGDARDISFLYLNPEIADILQKYTADAPDSDPVDYRLLFDPFEGVKESPLWIRDAVLVAANEEPDIAREKVRFMQKLADYGLIEHMMLSDPDPEGQITISCKVKHESLLPLLKDKGHIFELILQGIFQNSGLFDDIQTGVHLAWDNRYISCHEQVRIHLENMILPFGLSGAALLKNLKDQYYYNNRTGCTDNEIDVVAMKGMTPIFVSCKTGGTLSPLHIYEIDSLSARFHAVGVMGVHKDLSKDTSAFAARAAQTGISLFGTDILYDAQKTEAAIRLVLSGRCVTSRFKLPDPPTVKQRKTKSKN